jgi:hypothetical protein
LSPRIKQKEKEWKQTAFLRALVVRAKNTDYLMNKLEPD